MKTAAISGLKVRLSEYHRSVKRGEEVLITERGRPVARLVPVELVESQAERIKWLVNKGLLRPGTGEVREVLKRLPAGTAPEGAVIEAVADEREGWW